MGNKQRSVRLPEEMWHWLDQLPDRYGTNTNERLKATLYRGKEYIEREMEVIGTDEWMAAEQHDDYGKDQAAE